MTILHLALASDWDAARRTGEYRVSTIGRTLDEEGFIHACASHEQLRGVVERFYSDVTAPLVLLSVDPRGLDVRMEVPADSSEAFPHIYGPLPVTAVTSVLPFAPPGLDPHHPRDADQATAPRREP
ncbi:DUF952 domain-containing protein [Streptosporangium sp. NBC_01755]|uniref:DUF952 domain-containing protein n=1 Tax=unclassified Streptosporangium TaxID=2632669 RepID=UPI002DD9F925|nr:MULTISPECIES: DUF952 domain-containing protein [unclassified Streptosporangium]WSA28525.1 DUF952 domain-containing protein [Streptosporangium sp. NBC_01810]WSC99986.1 DUF952 domain-containing protein [Streptosporangium sp. NBC_01755]